MAGQDPPPLLWSNEPVKTSRPHAFPAILALVALLFAQLAVSVYACPGAQGMVKAAATEEAPPCHRNPAPDAPTPLCQAHCQQGDQSLDKRSVSAVAVSFVALPVTWRPQPAVAFAPDAPGAQSSLLERPTGPPLAVRHCRFLI